MTVRQLVLDAWAALSFKEPLEQPFRVTPSWVPRADQRRLAAYSVLGAYIANVGREYLRTTVQSEKDSHREYGDTELLVVRTVSGVLGEDTTIEVEGADRDLPDLPTLPEEPTPPADDAGPIAGAAYAAMRRVWEQRAQEAIDEWEAGWEARPALQERQEWLRQWADDELFDQRVWEAENQAVGLGDAVYVLAWSPQARRPAIRVYDPGFYFPVLDDEAAARGYPTTVHLVWEEDRDGDGQPDVVRKITWRLGAISPARDADGQALFDDNNRLVLADGDRLDDASGRIVRRYPWSPDEDSDVTCYLTDATWPLADANGKPIGAFDPGVASYAFNEEGRVLRDLDLRIDFVPVVHVPNTPAGQEHFGRSVLARVLQLLDDIADTDTDLQEAAALAGTPMVAVSGSAVPATMVVEPGAAYGLGTDGRMDAIDLSSSVEALRHVADDLRSLLSVNSQVSAAILGRVDPSETTSGFHFALQFGPYQSLVAVLRLVREQKYRLMLKFVQRLGQAGGVLEPGVVPPARLVFGSFLPADRKAVIEEVVQMVSAKLISRATGIRLLVAAGVQVEDVAAELVRVQSTDFDGANQLVDATGDEDAARAYLGLAGESPNPEPPPTPVLDL